MNWDAIGPVGELVGAVAVFATLVYLSIQDYKAEFEESFREEVDRIIEKNA